MSSVEVCVDVGEGGWLRKNGDNSFDVGEWFGGFCPVNI